MNNKSFLSNIKISYNAPVTLTFALISAVVLFLDTFLNNTLIPAFFTCPGNAQCSVPFDITNALDYARMLLHIFGHKDWNHFLGNMAFILLLGPVIEERYGSKILTLMMSVTAFVTGILNACFSPVPMFGSSDIAFMMILLTSFTSISKSEIPLSFILILILYIGREILGTGKEENIATLAHIAGGLCGSLFAFLATPRPKTNRSEKKASPDNKSSEEKSGYSYGFANLNKRNSSTASTKSQKAKKTAGEEETIVGSIEL